MRRATMLLDDQQINGIDMYNETMKKNSYFEKVNRYIYHHTYDKSKYNGVETFSSRNRSRNRNENGNGNRNEIESGYRNYNRNDNRNGNETARINKYPLSNNINRKRSGYKNIGENCKVMVLTGYDETTKYKSERNQNTQRNRNKQYTYVKSSLTSFSDLSDTYITTNEINKINTDINTIITTTNNKTNTNTISTTTSNKINSSNKISSSNNTNTNTNTNTYSNTFSGTDAENWDLKNKKSSNMKNNKNHILVCKVCYLQKAQEDVEQMKIRKLKTTVYPREFNNYMQYEKIYQMILSKKKKLVKCKSMNEKKTFINDGEEFMDEIMMK